MLWFRRIGFILSPVLFVCVSEFLVAQEISPADESETSTVLSTFVVKTSNPDAEIALPTLVEGQMVYFNLPIQNGAGQVVRDIKATVSCRCVSVKAPSELVMQPGETTYLRIGIRAPKDAVREQVTLTGVVGDSKDVEQLKRFEIGQLRLGGISLPPIRPQDNWIELNDSGKGTVLLLRAVPEIRLTDIEKVELKSDQLKIDRIEEVEDGYQVTFGLKEEATIPDRNVAALIVGPFAYANEPDQQMEELLKFTTRARLEVAPASIRLENYIGSRQSTGYFSRIIVKKLTQQRGTVEALLIANEDNRVLVIDPDTASNQVRIGSSDAYRLNISATVYPPFDQFLQDDKCFLIFHVREYPVDLTIPFDEFKRRYNVFPVFIP